MGVAAIDTDKQTVNLTLLQVHRGLGADLPAEGGWERVVVIHTERLSLDRFPLAKDAKVFFDGKEDPQGVKSVKVGMRVTVRLTADGAAIARLDATTSGYVVLKGVDADKNTITVEMEGKEQTASLLTISHQSHGKWVEAGGCRLVVNASRASLSGLSISRESCPAILDPFGNRT